jgi:hypothetical protein
MRFIPLINGFIWFCLCSAPAFAQTFNIPLATYPVGTTAIPETAIKQGITQFSVTIDRSQWTNPAATINAQLDLSADNGKTWTARNAAGQGWCGFTAHGTTFNPARPSSGVVCYCTAASGCNGNGSQNHIKGTVVISGAPITFSGTVKAQ